MVAGHPVQVLTQILERIHRVRTQLVMDGSVQTRVILYRNLVCRHHRQHIRDSYFIFCKQKVVEIGK